MNLIKYIQVINAIVKRSGEDLTSLQYIDILDDQEIDLQIWKMKVNNAVCIVVNIENKYGQNDDEYFISVLYVI